MKKLVVAFLLVSGLNNSIAQQNIGVVLSKNKQAYVYSFTGLNMRDSANANTAVVKLLNFGDTIEIVDITNIKCPPVYVFKKDVVIDSSSFEDNTVKEDLILNGNWVKIKYKNVAGFTNGIYLSSLPHFTNLTKKWEGKLQPSNNVDNSALDDETFLLLNKHYGIPKNALELSKKALAYKKVFTKKDDLTEISYTKKYKDGLIFTYKDSYYDSGAGGSSITISKKGMSFNEAVMYCRAFFYKVNIENKRNIGFYVDEEKYTITNYGEGSGCSGEIYKDKNGEWIVSYGCSYC
jgi:hypothetical protein